ncbi:uncharacterized protein APUU_40184S [Aspergillus puulaauensis]|uniref:Fungal N-terminal domain-containing protein n=1 Tax=Aspergillus puulaauensis TaxID=1220207 RepID=A0A7R8ANL6_9EURO|nr:uncharacterized protein APUU_40184S [Aspergillus puulaauensis]BCS23740.1 hypothetical protein APUU_40184S [Aspergillus puulaauensis]
MPDPFSAISGAAGVVSLGLTACQGLVAYYGPFKSFSTEAESFITSVNGLSATLELLKSRITRLQNPLNPFVADELRLVTNRINDCEGALQHLSQTLKKCQGYDPAGMITRRGKAFARAQYPFKRGTLVFLTQTVMGLQSNLDIALHALQLAMSHCIQQQNTSFLAVSRSMASDIATVPASLQHLHSNQQEILQIVTSIQQLQFTSIDQSTPRPGSNRAIPSRRQIAGRTALITPNQDSVETNCTCTRTGSWLFRSGGMLSGIRGHQFGCPKYYEREVTTLVNGKFTILNGFLGCSAYVSVSVVRENAGVTIKPTINIWPVVDGNSPAFQLLGKVGKYKSVSDVLAELRSLFDQGKASPRDTLPNGKTLIHAALEDLPYAPQFLLYCQFIEGLMRISPAGLNQQSDRGGTVFDTLLLQGTSRMGHGTSTLGISIPALTSLGTTLLEHGAVVTADLVTELTSVPKLIIRPSTICTPNYLFLPTVIDRCGPEEFPLSRLELAVFQRDEDAVKQLLGRFSPEYTLTERDECAYTSAIGWPHGMRIMLESYIPEFMPYLLHEAITFCQFQSAEIIVDVGQCRISEYSIAEATYHYNPAFFRLLAKSLATQRRHLRQLANQRLSPNHLQDLGVGDSESLLDAQSLRVEEALRESFGVSPPRWNAPLDDRAASVYHLISSNVDAAKALYSEGFTDVNQVNSRGLSPLSLIFVNSSIPGFIVAALLDDQHPLAPPAVQQLHDCVTPVVLRVCTFESLGLRHTCRYHYLFDPELGEVELDDIAEVQAEERLLIEQVKELVSEFELKYRELGVSLPEFLRGYWADRMEEVLAEDFDEDEARAMEEVGVVLDI